MIYYNIYIADLFTMQPLVFSQSGVPHMFMTIRGTTNPLYQTMIRMDKEKQQCIALMVWTREDAEFQRAFWL